jgi:hypothetical protein
MPLRTDLGVNIPRQSIWTVDNKMVEIGSGDSADPDRSPPRRLIGTLADPNVKNKRIGPHLLPRGSYVSSLLRPD